MVLCWEVGRTQSRNIRSALLKRRITEKQDNFRREEAAKRERLIQRRNLQGQPNNNILKELCSCRRESQDVGISQTQMSRKNSPAFLVASNGATICGTCSGLDSLEDLRTNQETRDPPPSLSAMNRRMDPFSPLDATLGAQVDSLVHFAVTSIWPAFRQSDYAGNCYQACMLQSSQNKLLIYSTCGLLPTIGIYYGSATVPLIQF